MHGGERVHTDPEHTQGLPFRLYQSGIRAITFYPGVEPEEVRAFLSALSAGIAARTSDDDLVTLLWQYDLPHIGLAVLDEAPEGKAASLASLDSVPLVGGVHAGGPPPGPTKEAMAFAKARPEVEAPESLQPDEASSAIPLSQDLLDSLQAAKTAEERQPTNERLADLLLDLGSLVEECEDYPVILELLERAVGTAMQQGDLAWTTRVLWELRTLASLDDGLPAAHREPLRQALARMGTAAVAPLGGLINKGHVKDPEVLAEFIHVLADEAVPGLCDVLGQLENRRDRHILCDILIRRTGENIGLLAKGLADPRWYVVRNIAYILGRTRNPASVPLLRRALDHPEPRVVREALRALDAVGMQQDRALLVPLLESRSPLARMWAIQHLAALKDPSVLRKLLTMIQAPDFEERPLADRLEVFKALGRAGTDDLLPMLQKMLAPARLFGRVRAQERQRCAIAALGALGTPEARALLTEGLGGSPEVLAADYRAALAGTQVAPSEGIGEKTE